MENKYYTPTIEEFHVGFEYEYKFLPKDKKFYKAEFEEGSICKMSEDSEYRVKYLDKEDIESLGFNDKHYDGIQLRDTYFKIKTDDDVYKITVYWNMLRGERENLIRIYQGELHNYPYTEIFRGDIKNKSELKRLLKQLNIK